MGAEPITANEVLAATALPTIDEIRVRRNWYMQSCDRASIEMRLAMK
jgi:hypothetical protein